jgi:hypothetical protein
MLFSMQEKSENQTPAQSSGKGVPWFSYQDKIRKHTIKFKDV